MRTIVVGDIHGCLEEFDELMTVVQYQKDKDELILIGDLVDRGPDSPGVVRRAREIGAKCIKGNHEENALRYLAHEYKKIANPEYVNPMRKRHPDRVAQWNAIPKQDWDWIAASPYFIRFDPNWIAVHAGMRSGIKPEEQDPRELMRLRYIFDETGKMAHLENAAQPDKSHPWYLDWKGPENIVYGHHVYQKPLLHGHTLGIDTGCCFGGYLTAMVKEAGTKEHEYALVQVRAIKEYSNLGQSWSFDSR